MTEKLVFKAGREFKAKGKLVQKGAEVDASAWPEVALQHYLDRGWLEPLGAKPAEKTKTEPKAEDPKAKEV